MFSAKAKKLAFTVAAAAGLALSTGCGVVEVPFDTAIGEGSDIEICLDPACAGFTLTTSLTGGIDLTASVDITFLSLFFGTLGTITVDQVLIAGSAIQLPPILDTGTLCISDTGASGGSIFLPLLIPGDAELALNLSTLVEATDPVAGGPGGLLDGGFPFDANIEQSFPFSITDALDLLGGGGTGDELVEMITTTIPGTPLGDLTVNATVVIQQGASADLSDPLVQDCIAFQGL